MTDVTTERMRAESPVARRAEIESLERTIEEMQREDLDTQGRSFLRDRKARLRELRRAEEAEPETPEDEEGGEEGEGEGQEDAPSAAGVAELIAAGTLPPHDVRTKECPHCKGWGEVSTGSQVDGDVKRKCWRCDGHGYLERRLDPDEERAEREQAEWQAPSGAIPYS